MKKVILTLIVLVILTGLFVFWLTQRGSEEESFVKGFVFLIEDERILVAEGLSGGVGGQYTGQVDQLEGEAHWITITDDTVIFNEEGDELDMSTVDIGGEVEVTVVGPVLDSYPAQAEASEMTVTGERYETTGSRTSGFVFSRDDNGRILVANRLADGVEEYTGEVDQLEGNAVWFSLTNETEILSVGGDELQPNDIAINADVEVYSTGPFLLSYPAQGEADRVVVTGENFQSESAQLFEEEGNLVRNSPGLEEGVWYINYEEQGSPALTRSLSFDPESVCVIGGSEEVCETDLFKQGERVRVVGKEDDGTVKVVRLIVED